LYSQSLAAFCQLFGVDFLPAAVYISQRQQTEQMWEETQIPTAIPFFLANNYFLFEPLKQGQQTYKRAPLHFRAAHKVKSLQHMAL